MGKRFTVQRHDLRQIIWEDDVVLELDDDTVRLRIDSFALTSNNITYAVLSNAMGYWNFFPTNDPGTGCVPVWGFASVVESRCAGVDIGERFYGYWPIAEEVVLRPARVDAGGFVDDVEYRRALPSVYNQYVRCSADPGYTAEREAQQALLRPLFATSFLLDDFLADNEFFGAESIVLSSASSKTAYGTAFCLGLRQDKPAGKVVGLTSPDNLEFVRELGCYDEILRYDEVATALVDQPSVYVDFSGSATVRAAVHRRLGDSLRYSSAIGATHWDQLGGGELPGPAPVLFFAPDQAAKRAGEWGTDGLLHRIAESWQRFMEPVTRTDDPWLTVVRGQGAAAVEACYTALLDGTVSAREGYVLSV